MNIATTKLELVQQLLSIADEKTLRKVANFFKKEVPLLRRMISPMRNMQNSKKCGLNVIPER